MIDTDPRSPAAQLRRLLIAAREQGLLFEEVWEPCLRQVRWPHDTTHRHEWKAILGDGKFRENPDGTCQGFATPPSTFRTWKAAYYGDPVERRAAAMLTLVAA